MSALLDTAAVALIDPEAVPAAMADHDGDDAAQRFNVHRNTVATSLIDALAEATPVTRDVVGDAFFSRMANARVRSDPPRSPVLAEYADGFGDFIAGYAPAGALPWLADLARLEALRLQAWHSADADPLPVDAYDTLLTDPDALQRVRPQLHPACRWLRSGHAVGSVWDAHRQVDVGAALAAIDINRGEDILVTRPQFDVRVLVLPAGGAVLLESLAAGAGLGDAFSAACAEGVDGDAATLFALMAGHGLVTAFHDRSSP